MVYFKSDCASSFLVVLHGGEKCSKAIGKYAYRFLYSIDFQEHLFAFCPKTNRSERGQFSSIRKYARLVICSHLARNILPIVNGKKKFYVIIDFFLLLCPLENCTAPKDFPFYFETFLLIYQSGFVKWLPSIILYVIASTNLTEDLLQNMLERSLTLSVLIFFFLFRVFFEIIYLYL